MPKHIHADLITKYAEFSHITDKPWKYFQVKYEMNSEWEFCIANISFSHLFKYRLKPRTIKIGNIEIPEPIREPLEDEDVYFTPMVDVFFNMTDSKIWTNDERDLELLQRGMIHLNRKSAELHAKALIALTAK
jgi:hypothetical protein